MSNMPLIVKNYYKTHPLKILNINGKEWEYMIAGQGKETLLYFPGAGQTAQTNFRLISVYEKKYKIIVPNLINIDSVEEFCANINHILNQEKANRVILHGLSLGSLLAQSYLRRNKNKVSKIIISHGCTPNSKLYNRMVKTLQVLDIEFGAKLLLS